MDGQTDEETDGQTAFSWLDHVACNVCSVGKMQSEIRKDYLWHILCACWHPDFMSANEHCTCVQSCPVLQCILV